MRKFLFLQFIMVLVSFVVAENDNCACNGEEYCVCPESSDTTCYIENEVYGCVNPRIFCSDSCDDRTKNLASCNHPWKVPSASLQTVCPAMACICQDGYARDFSGQCIPVSKCPASIKCGENEYYSTCKSQCYSDSCNRKDLFLRDYNCDNICDGAGGCTCESDYARNKLGKCVKRADCDKDGKTDCGPNEEYKQCKSSCLNESCADSGGLATPRKRGILCKTPCVQSACQCKANFYRSIYAFYQCVPSKQCPKENSNNESSDVRPLAGGAPAEEPATLSRPRKSSRQP